MTFRDDALFVKSGDIPKGIYGIAHELMAGEETTIFFKDIQQCSIVSDVHESYQTGVGRIAGGIIGGVFLGPIGAAAGLLSGGKKRFDRTIILCRLNDGRSFTAECSQLTAANLTQVANANSLNRNLNSNSNLLPESRSGGGDSVSESEASDYIECPLCAENIKAKAKICRFCGCKPREFLDEELQKLKARKDVEDVFIIDELYKDYIENSSNEILFDKKSIIEILSLISQFQKLHPDMTHRNWVEMVKDKYYGKTKEPIYDMIKNGFKFVRSNKHFEIIDEKFIAIKSSDN